MVPPKYFALDALVFRRNQDFDEGQKEDRILSSQPLAVCQSGIRFERIHCATAQGVKTHAHVAGFDRCCSDDLKNALTRVFFWAAPRWGGLFLFLLFEIFVEYAGFTKIYRFFQFSSCMFLKTPL